MSAPPPRLGARIVRGGAWVSARQATAQLAGLLHVVVIARLLPPEQIGLLGTATLMLTIATQLTVTGFEQAIVQRKVVTDLELHVAWTATALRGIVLGVVLAACAPLAARFFEQPMVLSLVWGLACVAALEGLSSMSVVLFRRELDFRRLFWVQTGGQLAEVASSIALAIQLRSVWALVAGRAIGVTTRVVISYLTHPYRPQPTLDRPTLQSLVAYGKWVTLSSVALLVLVHGDNFFVAKLLGPEQLAFYQYAYRLSNLPATALSDVLSVVMFPAYAAVSGERSRLGSLYARTLSLTTLLAVPAAVLIFALARELTLALLGERWEGVIELARVLSLFGLMRALGATTGPFFLATNRPALRAKIQVVQLVVFLATVVPLGLTYGAVGVALAATLYGSVALVAVHICVRLGNVASSQTLLTLGHTLVASGCAALAVRALDPLFADTSLVGLAVLGLVGAGVYALGMLLFDALVGGRYLREAREIVAQISARPRA